MAQNYKFPLKLILDATTWKFRVNQANDPTMDGGKNFHQLKQLNTKDFFYVDVTSNEVYSILIDRRFDCWSIGCQLDGGRICLTHPVIYVKENRPTAIEFSAKDTVPEFLYIAQSNIPGAGLGVFARLPLPVGLAFGPYAGEVTSGKSRSAYAWDLQRLENGDVLYVDGKDESTSNWLRYVNCPRWEEEQNMFARLYDDKVYYVTYKPISAYSELTIWYGLGYAKVRLKIPIPDAYQDFGMAPPKSKD